MKLFVKDRDFYRLLASIAVPIAAQQLITVGVNMADNIMLGQLGEAPMSGATLANNFISIFQICCMGLGMGASVLTSRFWGMKDIVSLKKAINIMYRLMLTIALGFCIATVLVPEGIMGIFTTEEAVILAGTGYLLVSICSFFINIFFNWLFIFGSLGAPRLEVRGAALGTLLARICEFTVTMGFFFFKDKQIRMRIRDLRMKCSDLMHEYIRTSIPVLVSDTLLGIGNSAVAVVMGHVGSSFVAANSITMVTQQLTTVVIQGISQASCAITGITLGEGDTRKAQDQGVTFAALGFIIGVIGCGLIMILRAPVINAYQITPETRELAFELMDGVAITVVFMAVNSILTKGVLRGGGDTRFLMVADIIFLWLASIPLGALAGLVWHWPGFWIFIMLKIDQFIKAIWCIFRLRSGKWIKKIEGGSGS